jgi:hypothetical protein
VLRRHPQKADREKAGRPIPTLLVALVRKQERPQQMAGRILTHPTPQTSKPRPTHTLRERQMRQQLRRQSLAKTPPRIPTHQRLRNRARRLKLIRTFRVRQETRITLPLALPPRSALLNSKGAGVRLREVVPYLGTGVEWP